MWSKNGGLILKEKRVFCYVKKTLQEFLKLHSFAEKCEEYKKSPCNTDLLGIFMMDESGKTSRMQRDTHCSMFVILLDVC